MTALRTLTALAVAAVSALTITASPADAARTTTCATTARDGANVGEVKVFVRHGEVAGKVYGAQRVEIDAMVRDELGGVRYRLAKDVQLVQWWAPTAPYAGGAGFYVHAEAVDRNSTFLTCVKRRF